MACDTLLEGCLDVDSSVKFSADNVDHNTCTLNGLNTFHGMGMIASISKGKFCITEVPCKKVSGKELLKKTCVDVIQYHERKKICFMWFQISLTTKTKYNINFH